MNLDGQLKNCDLKHNPLEMEYGGIPPGGGYIGIQEYDVGIRNIAEAVHCILGSLQKKHGQKDKRVEQSHINEEMGLIEKRVNEYSKQGYIEDWWIESKYDAIENIKEVSPKLNKLANCRLDQLKNHEKDIDPHDFKVAKRAYIFLKVLSETCGNSVANEKDKPFFNCLADKEVYWQKMQLANAVEEWNKEVYKFML
jgi:hypothetical protein